MRLAWFVLIVSATASADRYVVQRGETLEQVAAAHGCTTEVVEHANHIDTSLVKPGTVVEVPNCGRITTRARTRERVPDDDDAKAKRALAVIDGATWVSTAAGDVRAKRSTRRGRASSRTLRSSRPAMATS